MGKTLINFHKRVEMNETDKNTMNAESEATVVEPVEVRRSPNDDFLLTRILNKIGDFFSKMIRGIIVFAFVKLPIWMFRSLFTMKWLRLFISAWRALMLMMIWIATVFAAWLAWDMEKFIRFWRTTWMRCQELLLSALEVICSHGEQIWFGIALIGSVYGLVFLPAKFAWRKWKNRREEKMNKDSSAPIEEESLSSTSDAPEVDEPTGQVQK